VKRFRLRRSQCYPGDAPSASATVRKVGRNGKDAGRCTTTRRTETSTRAPSFNTVHARPDLSPRTIGACGSQTQLLQQHVSRGGQQHANWLAQKSLQLVRSICNSCSFRGRDGALLRAPRIDPCEPDLGTRLPPRVLSVEAPLRPRMPECVVLAQSSMSLSVYSFLLRHCFSSSSRWLRRISTASKVEQYGLGTPPGTDSSRPGGMQRSPDTCPAISPVPESAGAACAAVLPSLSVSWSACDHVASSLELESAHSFFARIS